MEEPAFIKQNLQKWKRYEHLAYSQKALVTSPDEMAESFIQLTDDLAYARTFFPESNTTRYLNELAAGMHARIYKNKKEKTNRFVNFWRFELPMTMARARLPLLASFLVFLLGMAIGGVSAVKDPNFVRSIMGDEYVDMTLDNIDRGEPLAVYDGHSEFDSFLGITVNNIKVSFMAFAGGALVGLGTLFALIYNGIMLGSFHVFFFQYGQVDNSLLTIYIHGTLEISAIIIAGAAGFVMGKSILFPGTYTRMRSFMQGARDGLKIVIGLVPVFVAAGFLESFATRFGDAEVSRWGAMVFLYALAAGVSVLAFLILKPKKALWVMVVAFATISTVMGGMMMLWHFGAADWVSSTRVFNWAVIILSLSGILIYFVVYPLILEWKLKKGELDFGSPAPLQTPEMSQT